jgi:hypothetical protein
MILNAALRITAGKMDVEFTRAEIRNILGIEQYEWLASYSPIFQGMRCDHPGGAPSPRPELQGSFRRISHGRYVLTEAGLTAVRRVFEHHDACA